MVYNYATTYLTCEGDYCQLKIIPPHRKRRLNLKLDRNQFVIAKTFPVDEDGNVLMKKGDHRGDEMYESYGIVLNQFGKDAAVNEFEIQRESLRHMVEESLTREDLEEMERYGSAAFTDPDLREKFAKQKRTIAEKQAPPITKSKRYDLPNLEMLGDFATLETEGQYMVTMRRYNVRDKRRRVSSLVNKVNLYINGTKDRLVIRENRNIVWQGIVGLVFGVFSLLLSLVLGQFFEPQKIRTRGPGSRNQFRNSSMYHQNYGGDIASFAPRTPRYAEHNGPKAYGGYVPEKNSYSY